MNTRSGNFLPIEFGFDNTIGSWALITNFQWYITNIEKVENWTNENLSCFNIEGAMIQFKDKEERLLFLLMWMHSI